MMKHFVRLATVMALVLALAQVAGAISPIMLTKGKPVKNAGIVLPMATELDVKELEEIEGEGLVGGLLGGIAGAITGAISYTVDYCWDVYVDDALERWFGESNPDDADNDRSWEWSSFYDTAGKAATAGFLGGLILP